MNDTEVRLACLDAAVRTNGNPNTVAKAREYYQFVTEGFTGFVPAEKALTDGHTSNELKNLNSAPKGQKGPRK